MKTGILLILLAFICVFVKSVNLKNYDSNYVKLGSAALTQTYDEKPAPKFVYPGNNYFLQRQQLKPQPQLQHRLHTESKDMTKKLTVLAYQNVIRGLQTQVKKLTSEVTSLTVTCYYPFVFVNGICYSYQSDLSSWNNAAITCQSMGGFLAIPNISIANDKFGEGIKMAFPAANDFFIGVVGNAVTANDLDGYMIYGSNSRWTSIPTFSAATDGLGVFVTIPSAAPSDWIIDLTPNVFDFKPYLCQQ